MGIVYIYRILIKITKNGKS